MNLPKRPEPRQAHGENHDWFALVCYLADPLKSQIEMLRRSIPSRELPPLHITVLPPRPVSSDVASVCALIEDAARHVAPFEAELSELRRFPETNFLYLDIEAGAAKLRELHARLSSGELAHAELHEYRPHLTLGGPVSPDLVAEAEQEAARQWGNADIARVVRVEELVCLWLAGDDNREWKRVASYSLSGPAARQTAAGYESKIVS